MSHVPSAMSHEPSTMMTDFMNYYSIISIIKTYLIDYYRARESHVVFLVGVLVLSIDVTVCFIGLPDMLWLMF